MSDQLSLLPEADGARITTETSIQAALGAFQQFMRNEGFSIHTQKSFLSDMRLLIKYLGAGFAVGDVGSDNLNEYLHWMDVQRGVPCSGKTYARRVTTVKVFFSWLYKTGVLVFDPAIAVAQRSVRPPLTEVLSPEQLEVAVAMTEKWRSEGVKGKKDARPHLLLMLLLQTGVKKNEAMAIVLNHIDRTNLDNPVLHIHYKNASMRFKERKINLHREWLTVLDEYVAQYRPKDILFSCTPRNLEYVLHDIAEATHLPKHLFSFENLRWASAFYDFVQRVDETHIRQKLGISKITWRETRHKLAMLAEHHGFNLTSSEEQPTA